MMECVICGKPSGMTASKLSHGNGWLCSKCLKAAGGMSNWFTIRNLPVEDIRARIEGCIIPEKQATAANLNSALANIVSADKGIAGYIRIDESHRTVVFPQVTLRTAASSLFSKPSQQEYDFDEILGWELLENESSITKGGLGSAVVGGALFGGAGAITGGVIGKKKSVSVCNSLRVKVTLRNMEKPVVFIDFLQSPAKTTSIQYTKALETAHKVMALLQNIYDSCQQAPANTTDSSADEIRKYKELLDSGAITEDEYNSKKKQLLGL